MGWWTLHIARYTSRHSWRLLPGPVAQPELRLNWCYGEGWVQAWGRLQLFPRKSSVTYTVTLNPADSKKIFWPGSNLLYKLDGKFKTWAPNLHFDGSRTHVQVDTSHKPLSDEPVVGRHFSQRIELLRHKVKFLLAQWLFLLIEIFQLKTTNKWLPIVWTIIG